MRTLVCWLFHTHTFTSIVRLSYTRKTIFSFCLSVIFVPPLLSLKWSQWEIQRCAGCRDQAHLVEPSGCSWGYAWIESERANNVWESYWSGWEWSLLYSEVTANSVMTVSHIFLKEQVRISLHKEYAPHYKHTHTHTHTQSRRVGTSIIFLPLGNRKWRLL